VKCSVTQREVGVDTDSFAVGLQAALRQDPDVVVISELRDPETLETAIRAAETGHLIISTMPTADVMATIARLHSMFPAAEREVGLLRLSEALRGVVAQRLLPRKEDDGRITVVEVLVSTPTARACLRDADKLEELEEEIESGEEGMQTFAQHAGRLVKEGDGRQGSRPDPHRGQGLEEKRALTARQLFDLLTAGPREAGTPPAHQARIHLRQFLEALGYSVREQPFDFSAHSLWAFPIFGAGVGVVGLVLLPLLRSPTASSGTALIVCVAGVLLFEILAWKIGIGARIPGTTFRNDANLIAVEAMARFPPGWSPTSTPRPRPSPWPDA
jgi:hypothetical protein